VNRPPRRAVIDIGSNTIRLVVFGEAEGCSQVLYSDKITAGLGRGVVAGGRLERESLGIALDGLERFAALVRLIEPEALRVVATAAVRDAENGADFLAAVRALGLPVELLSGEEEARASAMGVLRNFPDARGLVADLGGGSLELARVGDGAVHECVSFPFGVMRVAAIRAGGRGRLRKALARALVGHAWLGQARGQSLYLVGGAWRALGRLEAALSDKAEGAAFSPARARRLKGLVRTMGPEALAQFKGIKPARAAQLGDASALLAALVGEIAPGEVVVSSTGLREGLLAQFST
jgi:exopolyphosphatase/guanosine-5'-triphosphate,3'-diphosphate pyrophosphatase